MQLLSDGQMNEEAAPAATGRPRPASAACSASSMRERINELQHIAVEQSRLGIPILFAYDTIHGYRTIFPIPLGTGSSFDPDVGRRRPPDRRARVGRGRAQADLQPDGRRLARAPLGPHLRGRRRGPVPQLGHGRRAREGRAGPRLRGRGQGRHERQALRGLRPAGGRARLRHDRHVRAAAAEPLPAAVQGRDRRGLRHRDVLVQRHQRRPGLREQAARDRHPQERVELGRLHRERLHRRRGAAQPRHGRLAGRRGRAGAEGRHRLRDGVDVHPRQRQAAARRRQDLDGAPRRRGPPDPADQVPCRAVREPVRRPVEGRGRAGAARGRSPRRARPAGARWSCSRTTARCCRWTRARRRR